MHNPPCEEGCESGCCFGANDAPRNLGGKGKGRNIPAFIFIPTNPPFLPGFSAPPSLLLLSQGSSQVWEVGFSWSISGFAKFLPDFEVFFCFPPSCLTPGLSHFQSAGGSSGVLEVMDGSGRAGAEPLELQSSVHSACKSWECGSGPRDWGHALLLFPGIYWTGSRESSGV